MTTLNNTTVQINRVIGATLDRVYAAWTDLETAKQWWGPEGVRTEELILVPRVGGKFRWVLTTPDGERMTTEGEFREVRPGERLAFTWNAETLVTVEFKKNDDATTEICLTHENLPDESSRDSHADGWNSALDKLAALFAPPSETTPL